MKQSFSPWLQLYFVLASLLGLILIVIGTVTLINTGLNATVLNTPESAYRPGPPGPYLDVAKLENNESLSDEEKASLAQWQADYKAYQENESKRDYELEGRKQAISFSIAMLVTGIPIFAVHAPVIFRQVK
jgi:hypothetical protein